MESDLNDKEQNILQHIKISYPAWVDRHAVADRMGKKRLNSHDIDSLESLVEKGLIARDTRVTGITEKFLYRYVK